MPRSTAALRDPPALAARRIAVRFAAGLFATGLLAAASFAAGREPGGAITRREDLLGAWRLVGIEVKGPNGAERDPFYGAGSQGLLIYDASGWFSVQIMGQPRPSLDAPASRPEAPSARRDGIKAAAIDSYYAYYGTWSFDEASSTVTHHAVGALYPGEIQATYRQQVEVHGSRMTFTRTQGSAGHATVQTKVWERVSKP